MNQKANISIGTEDPDIMREEEAREEEEKKEHLDYSRT